MGNKPHRKPDKRQKKLERTVVNVSLAPGQPPSSVSALQALGAATRYRDAKQYDTARFICLQLLGHEFASVDASIIMLEIAMELRRPTDTHEFCQRLLKIPPRQLHAAVALAQALRSLNQHDTALAVIDRALKVRPTSRALRCMHAGYLIEVNEKEDATAELRSILRIDRKYMPAYRHLAALDALTDDEIEWLERTEFAGEDRITAFTTLATVYRKRKDADKEFRYLDLAQAEIASKTNWQPTNFTEEVQATIDAFDADFFARGQSNSDTRRQPIFIVGMPRSGSTLTEQILETNQGVAAIGESTLLHSTIQDFCRRKFGDTPFLEAVQRFDTDDFGRVADEYLGQVATIYTDAPVFIDKQLNSYMYLGLLYLAFPNAKFVHTLRNPLDNCLSCYQQVFEDMETSRTLESLADMYRSHLQIMDHWKRQFGERIFTARYEDMIADPQRQARALLEFCDIPWHEGALDFHANKTAVKTASMMQVRKPIYSSSVEKWRRYGQHLEPVARVLGLDPDGSRI